MSSPLVESLDTEAEGGRVERTAVGRVSDKGGKDKSNSYKGCDCKAGRRLVELLVSEALEMQLAVSRWVCGG